MSSPTYDAVLLPPSDIAALSIRVSERLATHGGFRLRAADVAIPHMSLYMSTHDADAVVEVAERMAGIARRSSALPLTATRYAQMPDGFVEIQYEVTPPLVRLQGDLLSAISPLREGAPQHTPGGVPFPEAVTGATGEERHNYETWGYPECGGLFRPHISFTRLRDLLDRADFDGLPRPGEFSGVFTRLALCTMGPDGTCPAIVDGWELPGRW